MWSAAINRAIAERSRKSGKEAMDALAERLLEKADEGDIGALKEIGDRLDGKPAQDTNLNVQGSLTTILAGLGRRAPAGEPDNP